MYEIGKKIKLLTILAVALIFSGGCSTLGSVAPSFNADQTAQSFFDHLQRSHRQEAYNLFAKGLSQTISFSQFDQFIDTLQEHWGRIESNQTAVMPFHKRLGESDFIPLNTLPETIKRYIFDVKFENAEVNCDLTLVLQGDEYKIVWFSFWGSSIYMTPEINEKIQKLFEVSPEAS